jgi:DNA-binding NarL/FixJ family response regulator
MEPYRIVIADDHVMVREGICNIVDADPGLAVVGQAGDGLELLKVLKQTNADMVILDVTMPGLRGLEVAREIHTSHKEIQVLFLSMHKNREFLSMAMAAGAKGYLLKEDSGTELLRAIKVIRNGQTYLSAKLISQYPSDIIDIFTGHDSVAPDALTNRERQVLKLIAEGKTDRQIGELLFISLRTVQRHRFNIRTKLNLKHTADLVKYAISHQYTEKPD